MKLQKLINEIVALRMQCAASVQTEFVNILYNTQDALRACAENGKSKP